MPSASNRHRSCSQAVLWKCCLFSSVTAIASSLRLDGCWPGSANENVTGACKQQSALYCSCMPDLTFWLRRWRCHSSRISQYGSVVTCASPRCCDQPHSIISEASHCLTCTALTSQQAGCGRRSGHTRPLMQNCASWILSPKSPPAPSRPVR